MTKRILLIDGDMVAYRVAAAQEKELEFDGTFILTADADEGRKNLDLMIEDWITRLEADAVLLCFTDADNYRKDVLPTYKSNRKDVRRPMILKAMRAHCEATYECMTRPRLEADDCLGIVATHPKIKPEFDEKIIVTWDKDLLTVPGLHWNPEKGWKGEGDDREPVIVTMKPKDADNMFYAQCLSGDAVDGYAGCPGIGKKRAEQIVVGRTFVYPHEEEIQRGPRKGEKRILWKTTENPDPWLCIVAQYEKAGLSEAEALQTAQVARILRASDYDFKKKEPILWTPSTS